MERYKPTNDEINAVLTIANYLNDAININNDYFYDSNVDESERKLIYEATKKIYKSCLVIYKANKSLPFG